MQPSRCNLTEGIITSLVLLATLFLMRSRMLLAFLAVWVHCWLIFSWLSTITSMFFYAGQLSSQSSSLHDCMGWLCPKCSTQHWLLLNILWLDSSHWSSISSSFYRTFLPSGVLTATPYLGIIWEFTKVHLDPIIQITQLSLEECYLQLATNWIEMYSVWLLELIHLDSSSLSEHLHLPNQQAAGFSRTTLWEDNSCIGRFFEINTVSSRRRFNMSCWLYLHSSVVFYNLCVFTF